MKIKEEQIKILKQSIDKMSKSTESFILLVFKNKKWH